MRFLCTAIKENKITFKVFNLHEFVVSFSVAKKLKNGNDYIPKFIDHSSCLAITKL